MNRHTWPLISARSKQRPPDPPHLPLIITYPPIDSSYALRLFCVTLVFCPRAELGFTTPRAQPSEAPANIRGFDYTTNTQREPGANRENEGRIAGKPRATSGSARGKSTADQRRIVAVSNPSGAVTGKTWSKCESARGKPF